MPRIGFDRVLIRSRVRDAELPALMPSAALFLYPSLFEGFGLPIVEALSAGVPVIASQGGCFPEAGGPGSRYFPVGDAGALAAQIRQVLDAAALADRTRMAGRSYARRFEARALTARLLALSDAVLHGRLLPEDGSCDTGEERSGCAG